MDLGVDGPDVEGLPEVDFDRLVRGGVYARIDARGAELCAAFTVNGRMRVLLRCRRAAPWSTEEMVSLRRIAAKVSLTIARLDESCAMV